VGYNVSKIDILTIAVVFLIIFTGCISEKEENKTINEGYLTIGISPAIPPMNYLENDVPTGFEIELISEISERMGLEPKFKIYEFSSILKAVQNNEVDCAISFITKTPERDTFVDFSRPYFETYTIVLVRNESEITGIKNIQNKKVGVLSGSTEETLLEELQKDASFEIVSYDNLTAMQNDLISGKIDSEVCEYITAKELIEKGNPVKIVGERIDISYIAIPVNGENDDLKNEIDDILFEMENDGTLLNLKKKWGY